MSEIQLILSTYIVLKELIRETMGNQNTKEQVIVEQSNVHVTLTAVTLALVFAIIFFTTCYFILKKIRNNVIREIQRENRIV